MYLPIVLRIPHIIYHSTGNKYTEKKTAGPKSKE